MLILNSVTLFRLDFGNGVCSIWLHQWKGHLLQSCARVSLGLGHKVSLGSI